ncbi:RNA polymerase subunit sigma-24 [Sphingobacteriaceae bacterium]|nr:RNA polymerase subunit sigma-24 [Sphingobacteriaceae bacterium]
MEIHPDLIARCANGDRKAENELYKNLYGFLMSICRRYIRQEEKAREVLNIGFCRVLLNIGKYKPVAPFQYWARRIMVNVLINEHKKEKLHYGNYMYVETLHDDEKYSEINNAIEKFNVNRIALMIEKLPAATRQVFNLFIVDGYSHHEISEMLDISEGTSKWHLNAAREKLKGMLAEKKIKLEI